MSQANVERVAGGYVVSRYFESQAAAQHALNGLLAINESAFMPSRPARSVTLQNPPRTDTGD